MTLRAIHDFELALTDVCLAMSARGLRVDEARRQRMIADLDAMREPLLRSAEEIVLPKLAAEKRLPNAKLFRERWTCPCCRNGKAKRTACWSCAGFEKKPGKRALGERTLTTCAVCNGEGQRNTLAFNPGSPAQVAIVLYNVLRLPKRTRKGRVTVDEEALKSVLAADRSGLVETLLRLAKAATMRSILERIAPAADGCIRTSYNPAGTETGRFSSAETFLFPSTNLQNMPKREATEAAFDVRRVFVASEGMTLIEADLSGAEAWVTAACAGDDDLLARLRGGLDVHRWTASKIFSKPMATITDRERFLGKVARHALNYGMQWATFLRNVNAAADKTGIAIDATEAKRVCTAYHALHPRLQAWWRDVADRLGRDGALTNCFGFRRQFFGRGGRSWLSETHREAIAFEPQSTVAMLLNRGLLRWFQQHDGKLGDVLAQVHDSIIVEVATRRAKLAGERLAACMREPLTVNGRTFVIPVEVVSGASWGEMT